MDTTTSNQSLNESLRSLELLSNAFDKLANDPKHYNNPLTQYLDNMSFELRKMKSEVIEYQYNWGGF